MPSRNESNEILIEGDMPEQEFTAEQQQSDGIPRAGQVNQGSFYKQSAMLGGNTLGRGVKTNHDGKKPLDNPNDNREKHNDNNKNDSNRNTNDKSSKLGSNANNLSSPNGNSNRQNKHAPKENTQKKGDSITSKLGKKSPLANTKMGRFGHALSKFRNRNGKGEFNNANGAKANSKGIIPGIIPISNPVIKNVVIAITSSLIPILLILLAIVFIASIIPILNNSSDGGDMCETNASNYYGSADVTEFVCKMQSPLGTKSYPLCGYVGEPRPGHTHDGVDLSLGRGTAVYAAQSGTVQEVHNSTSGGWGRYVLIRHGNTDLVTRYAHLSSISVTQGSTVGKGQKVGEIGGSGNGSESGYANHLHFSLYKNNQPQQIINDYFGFTGKIGDTGNCFVNNTNISQSFKQNCGAQWQGDPVGDSANQANDAETYSPSSVSSSYTNSQCCVTTTSSSATGTGGYCTNGITVEGSGTLSIDDYIAGVVTAENSYEKNGSIEASKANAIAARTYAINRTSNCKDKIGNSQAAQVYKEPGDIGKRASSETAGQVMLYNGNVFSSEYDSFCEYSGTATYRKVPSDVTHSITLNSNFTGKIAGGHCRGMSQLYARQLQDEGKKYDEILRFFYADGIEITGASSTNSCYVAQNSYTGNIVRYYQTDYDYPYSTFGTIKTHGCGPTAMATVVSSLTGTKHDPVELTNYACSNGFCYDSGTHNDFFAAAGKKYGLTVKKLAASDKGEVLIALNRGDSMVITLVGKWPYAAGGHFIVLTGSNGNDVSIHDPNSRENSAKTFDFEKQIVTVASDYWIISK